MLKKIKRWINNLLYAIPFGMKAANEEILAQKDTSSSNDNGIHQMINQNRVAKDLLKGEVTQQVEELRYRTYLIEHESKKYKYLGDGIAIKESNNVNYKLIDEKDKYFNFTQPNFEIIGSVEDELSRMNQYGKRKFTINLISDNNINKFNNEEYVISVHCDNKNGYLTIRLIYSIYPNKYDPISRILVNSLDSALHNSIRTNDSICNFKTLSFITHNAIGEEDYKEYVFKNLVFIGITKDMDKGIFEVIYESDSYYANYLMANFYNKKMEEKYINKEAKDKRENIIVNDDLKYKCSDCGKMISDFDAEQSKTAIGKIVCLDCLGKYVK